jgi:YVTN family beta-propeller protein
MDMRRRTLPCLLMLVLAHALSSCGGGGSSVSQPPPPPPPPPEPGFSVGVQAPVIPLQIQGISQGQSVSIQAVNGFSGTVSLSLQNLPAGVSTYPAFPLQLSLGQSQSFSLMAASSASVGMSTVKVVGTSGTLTESSTFSVQVTAAASFNITLSPPNVSLTPGSTVNILLTFAGSQLPPDLALNLPSSSVLQDFGLNLIEQLPGPAPNEIPLILSASALAQPAQNLPLYISSQDGNESSQATLSVSITSPFPPITAANRSTAVRADMGVTGAAYDSTRKLVFATVWQLNEVLVYSSIDASLKARIPVMLPFGIDESADGSKVYVGSFGPNIAVIDPDSLQVTAEVVAPTMSTTGCGAAGIVTLSNGKAIVLDECLLSEGFGNTGTETFLWDPVAATFTPLQAANFFQPGSITRSATHNMALLTGSGPRTTEILLYNAATDASVVLAPSDGNQNVISAALNPDGSQVAMVSGDTQGISIYNGQLQLLSTVPIFGTQTDFVSVTYSLDGKSLYAVGGLDGLQAAVAFDPKAYSLIGVAPDPIGGGTPYAIDETGMIFEGTDRGMEFFDVSHPGAIRLPTPFLAQPSSTTIGLLSLSAPTQFSVEGVGFAASDQYQVFFGSPPASPSTQMGSTPVLSGLELTTTAPPGRDAGAANVTVTRSDGWVQIAPDGATYGPQILAVDANAGPMNGGSQIVIYGYGLNGPGVQVSIGGTSAAISEAIGPGFISPFPYPMGAVFITTPPGLPGPADVTISTSSGATTMTGGFQYLAAVNVYPTSGVLNQIVYDKGRQRLYASNTSANLVDVFSLSSGTYLAPVTVGNAPLEIALTPDGSMLAVVNAGDGTVSVINPDTAKVVATYPVLTASDTGSGCQGQAWQITAEGTHGMVVDIDCTAIEEQGVIHTLDLQTGNLGTIQLNIGRGLDVLASSPDGNFVALADALGEVSLLNVATGAIVQGGVPYGDIAIDSDENRIVSGFTLYDANLSFVAFPEEIDYLETGPNTFFNLVGEKLNPSGSLLFVPQQTMQPAPHPLTEGVDVFDVHRQRLALRIALPDPLPITQNSMTLDETGTRMFLISNTGITVAQLQSAPLSIGSVSPSTGSPGTQITIRGSGFTDSSDVIVGTIEASTVFVDQNTLQATVPSGVVGPVRVSVSNQQGNQYSFDAAFVVQ